MRLNAAVFMDLDSLISQYIEEVMAKSGKMRPKLSQARINFTLLFLIDLKKKKKHTWDVAKGKAAPVLIFAECSFSIISC